MQAARSAKVVVLEKPFAGIPAGSRLLIATPAIIADYLRRVPRGETRGIVRLRNELARRHRAQATCPVTTAIFLRIVAESALEQMDAGAAPETVTPFWRAIAPEDAIAARLSCDRDWLRTQRALEGIEDPPPPAPRAARRRTAPRRER